MADDLTAAQVVARERIHDLLSEVSDLIGPAFGGDNDLDEFDQPVGNVFLSEWITVLSWVDEAGDSYLTRVGSSNLLEHHRVGLLHEGLYGFT